MSKRLLSKLDHNKTEKEEMRYLIQPRGPGKSWVFRMVTPPDLVGVPNPWDGKPLGKEIKKGLGTRHLPTARKQRDIALGDIRRLQDGLSDGEAFSLASAVQCREMITAEQAEAEAHGDPFNLASELVLTDKLEQAEARGIPRDQLKRFARVATGSGFPLELAHAQYIEARRPDNPCGYDPLKRATVANLDTAIKHLRAFLKDDAKTACLEDLTPELAQSFRDVWARLRNMVSLSSSSIARQAICLANLPREAHPAVEALHEAVLHGLAWRNVMPFDPVLGTPPQDGVRSAFRAVVTDNHPRPCAAFDQSCQFTRHPAPRDRRVRDRRQAFPGDVVDHVEHAEALAARELVMDEIQ